MDIAKGMNRVVLGPRPRRGMAVYGESIEDQMVGVQEGEAMREAKDIMMTESMIVIMTRTDNETEPEAGKPGHQ
jgi:hypothetical protein